MPRVTCRCGQILSVPVNGPDRVICPVCSAKIRVRRDAPDAGGGDGFVRFPCLCGRRLKVRVGSAAGETPQSGKCPDCGRVVPVPASSSSSAGDLKVKSHGPESPTEELDAGDLAVLDRWTRGHLGDAPPAPTGPGLAPEPPGEPAADPERAPTAFLPTPAPGPADAAAAAPAAAKAEVGLRVCPRCGRPLHLSAVACRNCGAPAPKR